MAVGIMAWTPAPASARLSDSTGEMTPAVHNNNRLRGSIPPSLSLTETEVRPYACHTDASQTVDYQQFITPPPQESEETDKAGLVSICTCFSLIIVQRY